MSETITRRYCVHGVAEAAARAHLVEGQSFEDAALQFVEHQHPLADAEGDVSLYVEDLETGERQCFRVDVERGEAEPCD